jgi:hypothetical protein
MAPENMLNGNIYATYSAGKNVNVSWKYYCDLQGNVNDTSTT